MATEFEIDVRHHAQQIQSCWARFVASHRAALIEKQSLESELSALAGTMGPYALSEWDVDAKLRRIYSSHVDLIIENFKRQLAAFGPAPEIEKDGLSNWTDPMSYQDFTTGKRDDLHAYRIVEVEHAANIDLTVVAERLINKLSPEDAINQAVSQAADRIQSCFEQGPHSSRTVNIEERGGMKIISTRRYVDPYEPWRLSIGDRSKILRLIQDLRTVLNAAGNDDVHLTADIRSLTEVGRFSSREKFEAGPGLEICMFKEKIEFRFASRTLDAVQIAMNRFA